ncbi:hypothetical protein VPH70E343_0092 [Vibrio phage 70E34-3]
MGSSSLTQMLRAEHARIRKMAKEEFKGVRGRDKCFLNDSHYEFGTVSWHVSTRQYSERDITVDADLRMTDCGDVINLEFGSSSERESSEKRMDKLDTLIESLQKFRSVLQKAHDFQVEHNKPDK